MNRPKVFRWWLRGMFQRLRCWILKPPLWVSFPTTTLLFHVGESGTKLVMIASGRPIEESLLPLGWTPPKFGGHYEVRVFVKLLGQQITGENLPPDPNAPEVKPTLLRDLEDPTVKAGFWRRKPS